MEPAGTIKDALKEPVLPVITGVGVVAIVEPPNVTVTWALAVKPEPETDTVELTIPEDGFKTMSDAIVKVAVPVLVPSVA